MCKTTWQQESQFLMVYSDELKWLRSISKNNYSWGTSIFSPPPLNIPLCVDYFVIKTKAAWVRDVWNNKESSTCDVSKYGNWEWRV